MTPHSIKTNADQKPADPVNWRGRSGRYYALHPEQLENFRLRDRDLYLIAEGNTARWIGTAGDLIDDQASRARFRAAVKVASAVLRLKAPGDMSACMAAKWDLEGGRLAPGKKLVTTH